MATRPLEVAEFNEIIKCAQNGARLENGKYFIRPNRRLALICKLQASLGLRICDILNLTYNNLKNGKLEIIEKKTKKIQYRDVHEDVSALVRDWVIEKRLGPSAKILSITPRSVQKQLKIITEYLGLRNVSTHSFRKMYATLVYKKSAHNIELLKELLNHSSIATTQRYIRVSQEDINSISREMNFT